MIDKDRHAVAEQMKKVAERVAELLPVTVREDFLHIMLGEAILRRAGETTKQTLQDAVRLTKAAAELNVDVDMLLKEVGRRSGTIGGLSRSMQSVHSDLTDYPSRWPGLR